MHKLCVIPGDGIGREVVPAAVDVLKTVVAGLEIEPAMAGWDCFLERGMSVPEETLTAIRRCGVALFGAVSSPPHRVAGYRSAIITMRQALNLYANIRPVQSWPMVSPRSGVNMLIVRENTEGLYSGQEVAESEETAVAQRIITRTASRRIAAKAVALARQLKRSQLTIVHKANVLPVSDGLFRQCVYDVLAEAGHHGLAVNELLVDVAALKMVASPEWFDVVVTTNLFGDILSDAAAHWGGGLGLAPSLNWGDGLAVAEPVHGSAPDIAGQYIANPIAAILSGALLVRHVWGLAEAADRVETAVYKTLADGLPTGPGTTNRILQKVLLYLR